MNSNDFRELFYRIATPEYSPTIREIAEAAGIKSNGSVHRHLHRLYAKGEVVMNPRGRGRAFYPPKPERSEDQFLLQQWLKFYECEDLEIPEVALIERTNRFLKNG